MRVTVLGSGSAGNAAVLTCGDRAVLLDAGFSCRQLTERLGNVGLSPMQIGAIVITHAHGDHTRGAGRLSRMHGIPVYTTEMVRAEWGDVELAEWRRLVPGRVRDICGFRFEAVTIPHDASETLAFRIETAVGAIGFATDIGAVTAALVDRFRECRVLVLESNHAADLLEVSPYDRSTRARIGGLRGHLSNESLAAFIRSGLGDAVRCIVLAHLSHVNNVPEIAEMTCREALAASGRHDVEVIVASQHRVTPTVDIGAWGATRAIVSRPVQRALPFDPAHAGSAPMAPSPGSRPRLS